MSVCSISDTRCVTLVTNPVLSHECGKERGVLTTGKHPLSCMTQIFRNGNFLVSSRPCYWLWAYLMIIDFGRTWWLLLTLSVPDDYWLWAYLMIIDFELHLVIVINFEHTWWLLLTLRVSDDWYWLWVYLMIVIDFERTWW
jgi:hypothetical protein